MTPCETLAFGIVTHALFPPRLFFFLSHNLLLLLSPINDTQVGFNMRKVTKGKVTIKLWDLGGQPRFRSMWERYCRGVNTIVYVVDAADADNISTSKAELHDLLAKPALEGIPTLILGNKNDLPNAVGVDELIEKLDLKSLTNREVCCYSISAKNAVNIDITMDWLIKHSKSV